MTRRSTASHPHVSRKGPLPVVADERPVSGGGDVIQKVVDGRAAEGCFSERVAHGIRADDRWCRATLASRASPHRWLPASKTGSPYTPSNRFQRAAVCRPVASSIRAAARPSVSAMTALGRRRRRGLPLPVLSQPTGFAEPARDRRLGALSQRCPALCPAANAAARGL
jgi:hypothetical protein